MKRIGCITKPNQYERRFLKLLNKKKLVSIWHIWQVLESKYVVKKIMFHLRNKCVYEDVYDIVCVRIVNVEAVLKYVGLRS